MLQFFNRTHRNFQIKEPILYVSTESHYSNMRLAELQQIETKLIPTDTMGRIIPDEFINELNQKSL